MNKRVSWEKKNHRDKRKEWSSRLCTKNLPPKKKIYQREVGEGNEKELEFVKSELKSLVVESKEKESCSLGEWCEGFALMILSLVHCIVHTYMNRKPKKIQIFESCSCITCILKIESRAYMMHSLAYGAVDWYCLV